MTRVIAYGASFCWFLSACSPESASGAKGDVGEGTDLTQEQETPKHTEKESAVDAGDEDAGMAASGTSSMCSPADCADPAKLECVDGTCVQRAIWGELQIDWEDMGHDVFDERGPFTGATYFGGESGGPRYGLVRLGAGLRLWQVYVGQDATLGAQEKGTFPFVNDGKAKFGLEIGARDGFWELATGTLTLSTLELKSGGRVEGTMEGTPRPLKSDPDDVKGPGGPQFKLRFAATLP